MCGIAGVVHFKGSPGPDPDQVAAGLVAMRDSMAHRGPDGEGLWVSDDGRAGLAHRDQPLQA